MDAETLRRKYKTGHRNFIRADLREADLRGADLRWATAGTGNYLILGVIIDGALRIFAGCRTFSWDEAVAHWQPENQEVWTEKTAEWGAERRAALAYIAHVLKPEGETNDG